MTREEAKRDLTNPYEIRVRNIIDKIYDEFELKICENCSMLRDEVCVNDNSPMCCDFVSNTFGCNEFIKN